MAWYSFLPKLLNMSLTSGVAIVFVLLMRLLLKKAPKVISYALWGVVLIRLLCPVSVESGLSLFGLLKAPVAKSTTVTSRIEYVPSSIVYTEKPAAAQSVPSMSVSNGEGKYPDTLPQENELLTPEPMEETGKSPMEIAACVWMAGGLAMGIYAAVSYTRLRRKLVISSRLRDNIYLADEITTPFVMGLIRPKIYLPSSTDEREQSYILMHEQHHIRRGDHIIKALAFTALCIHWFNPLVWVGFLMAARDMEMSCDEAVVRKMGDGILAEYSASLLALATGHRIIAGMPLTFGEGDPKGRIRNLAKWKKPALWITLTAVIVCAVAAVCLLTNPRVNFHIDRADIEKATYPPADQNAEAYAVSAAADFPKSFGKKVQRLISPDPSDGKMIVMTDDETLYYWGGVDGTAETHPHDGQINRITWREPPVSVYLSRFALCYVDTNGALWMGQLLSSPKRLAENVIYAEAFLNAGIALTANGKLCTWNQDSKITEVFQDVRAARSFGDEVFAIKNDDSLWKLSGFGTTGFTSSPEAEWVMDGVREISGHLVLMNDGTVRNLDADPAQAAVLGEVTHIASNGIAHAAIRSDGSLYLWGTIYLPGNRQESVVVDSPVLLCDNVSDAVPCYSGILILKCTGELFVCELVNGELVTSPIL